MNSIFDQSTFSGNGNTKNPEISLSWVMRSKNAANPGLINRCIVTVNTGLVYSVAIAINVFFTRIMVVVSRPFSSESECTA